MMEADTVSETLETHSTLTWLIAREDDNASVAVKSKTEVV
jgi:hypothetical protein